MCLSMLSTECGVQLAQPSCGGGGAGGGLVALACQSSVLPREGLDFGLDGHHGGLESLLLRARTHLALHQHLAPTQTPPPHQLLLVVDELLSP